MVTREKENENISNVNWLQLLGLTKEVFDHKIKRSLSF
jgi:hypothetical protein